MIENELENAIQDSKAILNLRHAAASSRVKTKPQSELAVKAWFLYVQTRCNTQQQVQDSVHSDTTGNIESSIKF